MVGGGRIAKLRAAAKDRGVMETMSLLRRIALTGSEADKTAADRILASANEQLKALINSQEQ
jgi:hypothetical protein